MVTLVTGDRVVLSAPDAKDVGVVPGKDRRHVRFHTHRKAGKLRVIPSDAEALVASGRLDPRLFDVTGLIESGYDDRSTKSIPLIVTYDGTAGRASVRSSGAEMVRELPSINGTAVRLAKGGNFLAGGQRLASGIERVWLDGKRHTTLDQSVPQIGTPAAWQAGYTGRGVTVAVLDTGVDATHPDLADRVTEARNFTGEPAGDQRGHGTHVASTIAGTAAASDGRYKGVAPDAKLLDGKVCGIRGCSESAILAGMQWAASEKGADVINMSLGGGDTPEIDPLEEAVNTLTAQTGSLFVIAAGNSGPFTGSVGSPGSAEAALTVGAVDKSDALAWFSSRGPRVGDAGVKPDITAPGVGIVAAKSKDGVIGDPVGDRYVRLDGTSMATPHTAGAAALLVQQHPEWSAGELKAVLMSSAKSHAGQGIFEQGAGRVDLAEAITQPVFAVPGSLSFGTARWPHDDDEPVVKRLTYRNSGGAEITLALTASLTGPDGQPAPAGALTLSAPSVTVPAAGTAAVTVTSNTRHGGQPGIYTGRVTATGPGGVSATIPLSVDLESEQYDLTVTHLDPDGRPAGSASTWITGIDTDFVTIARSPDGVAKIRVPKGKYFIEGGVDVDRGNFQFDFHSLIQPVLQVDRDTDLAIDARRTKPIKTTVPRADAGLHFYSQARVLQLGDVAIGGGDITFGNTELFSAPLGGPVPAGQFSALLHSVWGVHDELGGIVRNSPYSYHLMNTRKGQYWHGFARAVRDSDLAVIPVRHHWRGDNRLTDKFLFVRNADGLGVGAFSQVYDPPAEQTQLVDAGGNSWRGEYWELDPETLLPVTFQGGRYRAYQAGRQPLERWNAAVFGPGMQPPFPGLTIASRVGDRIDIFLPSHSDGDGHGGIWFSSPSDPGGSAKLYCNGELIENWTQDSMVPSGRCDFRHVVTTGPRDSDLTTRIDMDSTFSSQTTGPEGEALPMWAVRYRPAVDMRNAMKRLPVTVLPVELEPQPGAKVGSLTKVEVQVSGDDGTTWTKAAVRRTGDNRYVAIFATPAGGYVSLKGKAADSDGNTTEQTIVRAYALR